MHGAHSQWRRRFCFYVRATPVHREEIGPAGGQTMKAEVSISMADAMKSLELRLKVTRRREWAARIWLGTMLIKCAALVMGCGITVDVQDASSPEDGQLNDSFPGAGYVARRYS